MDKEKYFYTKNLSVGYQGVPLIKNVRLCLEKGEILTLIGPNGAGKTTILKTIIRQLSPLAGVAYLDGRNMAAQSGRELAKRMSVVLTGRIHTEMMTCREVVETGRYPYTGKFGRLSQDDRQVVQRSMELVHVEEISQEDFGKISDGQRQRVMLARALSQEPDLIVLDEPTSFLDIRHKLEFLSVLQRLSREQGLSVILSLHELDLAERISDKIACVRGDVIDRFGSPEEIFTPGYISRLYGIQSGSYEEQTGTPELPAASGSPQVFVLAGRGTGIPVYRRLQRQGIPFATGILWANDVDYPVARILAAEVVKEQAFCRVRPEHVKRVKELMDQCGKVICTLGAEEGGDFYPELKALVEYGKNKKEFIVHIDGKLL